jgi:hypothetical protein
MKRTPVAGGHLIITDEVVEADVSVAKSIQRIYHQSKLLSGGLIVAVIAVAIAGIVEYPPGSRRIIAGGILLLMGYIVLGYAINKIFRPHVSSETTIPREMIELIAYKEGGTIRRPSIAIVYQTDGTRKATNVFLSPGLLAEDAPLDRVLSVFEAAGIETKSVEEMKKAEM